jgi:hypothetical protein
MAKFFVGQRVRLVRPLSPSNQGATGRIIHLGSWRYGDSLPDGYIYTGVFSDCVVCFDQLLKDASGVVAREFPTMTDRLEPITPEGSAPSEFTTLHDLLESLEGVAA